MYTCSHLGSFVQQSGALHEAARARRAAGFWRVALPVAWPAVVGGLALVLMETVADYGVVGRYGVPTLTTGIFRTWFAMGESAAAMQLAGWLFIVVCVLVVAEQFARRGQRFNPVGRQRQPQTSVNRVGRPACFRTVFPAGLAGANYAVTALTVMALSYGETPFTQAF